MSSIDDIRELVELKNKHYGDSVGGTAQILFALCPDGIPPQRYHDLHIIVRMLDKISRIMCGNPPHDALIDAFKDICGYALLALRQLEDE